MERMMLLSGAADSIFWGLCSLTDLDTSSFPVQSMMQRGGRSQRQKAVWGSPLAILTELITNRLRGRSGII